MVKAGAPRSPCARPSTVGFAGSALVGTSSTALFAQSAFSANGAPALRSTARRSSASALQRQVATGANLGVSIAGSGNSAIATSLAGVAVATVRKVQKRRRKNTAVGKVGGMICRVLFGKRRTVDEHIENIKKQLASPNTPNEKVDILMGDLQQLMLSKVAQERTANTDMKTQIGELRRQISTLRESYSDISGKLRVEEHRAKGHIKKETVDVRSWRDAAVTKAAIAESRVTNLEDRMNAARSGITRDAQSRPVIRSEIKNLTQNIVNTGKEKERLLDLSKALADEVAGTTVTLDSVEAERAALQARLDSMNATVTNFAEKLSEAESSNARLLDAREIIQGEVSKLTKKVVDGSRQSDGLQQTKVDAHAQHADLEASIAPLLDSRASLEEQLEASSSAVSQLERAAAAAGKGKEAMLDSRKLIRGEVWRLSEQFLITAAEKKALDEQRLDLQETVTALQVQEAALTERLELSRAQASELARVDLLTNQDRAQLLSLFKVVEGEVRKLTDNVVEARRVNDGLEREMSLMNAALCELESRASDAEVVRRRYEDQVETAAKEKARLQGTITRLEGTEAQIAAQRMMIGQEVARLTGRVIETEGFNTCYAETVRSLEAENYNLLNQVSRLQVTKADLLGMVAAFRAESGKLTKTFLRMLQHKMDLSTTAATVGDDSAWLEKALKDAATKQKELQLQLDMREE